MVDYAIATYGADRNRVYATGFSSGAMMTNVMLGVYPEVFEAGASFSGVPDTCFRTGSSSEWNSQCSGGEIDRTPQQWGDEVRTTNPGYTGPWPPYNFVSLDLSLDGAAPPASGTPVLPEAAA